MSLIRLGQGFDSHRLIPGTGVTIGGVHIPCEYTLEGHSDADVLLHAIIDALFGALSLGNIGQHFPDNDAAYKNADSLILLTRAYQEVINKGYILGNLDSTVITQTPKLNPYLPAMVTKIAHALKTQETNISVKAKSNEGVGFVGRKEGMVALVSLHLTKSETLSS